MNNDFKTGKYMNAKTGEIEMKQKQDNKIGSDREWLWGVLVGGK